MTRPSSAPTWAGALAGIVAAGCGIAVGELVAGVDARLRGPIAAVGDRVIDTVPAPVKTWAIDTFGTNDKAVLLTGVTVLLAVFAVVVGVIALRRSLRAGLVGVGLFAGIGVLGAPGVLAVMFLAVLGYASFHERLAIVALLSLPLFVFEFYFALDVSLLAKAGTLVGTGLVLLAARFVMRRVRVPNGGDA